MKITVFGGSAPRPESPAYHEALTLGNLIGQGGHTAITGGYIGTMEAVSRGCAEAGGHVIGVTCDEIEAWRPVSPNPWVLEEIRYPTIHQRLLALIELSDAAFALPGGVGTLAEVAMMWNQMQTEAIPARPLILIGSGWQATFQAMFAELGGYVPEAHQACITLAATVEAGFTALMEQ